MQITTSGGTINIEWRARVEAGKGENVPGEEESSGIKGCRKGRRNEGTRL